MKIKISIAVLSAIFVAVFFQLFGLVDAQSAPTNATEYCRGQGTPGESRWQNCIDNINQQLDQCNDIVLRGGSQAARNECRERILSGDATREREDAAATSGELEGEAFNTGSNFDENADCKEGLDSENCGITRFLQQITDALLVLVGIVVVMMIVIGGIQYSAAGSNPQAVAAAKKKITQALLALVIYLFMGAFLQWLIPGGIF